MQLTMDERERFFQGPLRYTLASCSLGWFIVACFDGKVCYLAFGSSDDALLTELKAYFPAAELILASDSSLSDRVAEMIESPRSASDVPVAPFGTKFQKQVWAALRQAKPGDTATYAEIATAVGRPAAVRAVARACGANPVAVLIPCHRIIGSDGSLRGYRWGIELKRRLLERERV